MKLRAKFMVLALLVLGACPTLILGEIVPGGLNAAGINVPKLVDAIYLAEGGRHAKKPFGILSVKCTGYRSCRRVCDRTVRNNLSRFFKEGHQELSRSEDFISYLGKKYAPVGAENDGAGLNRNWVKNVKRFYEGKS